MHAMPLAVGRPAIDTMTRDLRADMVRGNMLWLLNHARTKFAGSAMRAMSGCIDRESVRLRQVAIYLGCEALGLRESDCAAAFKVDKAQASRAVRAVKLMRSDPAQAAALAELETTLARHVAVTA